MKNSVKNASTPIGFERRPSKICFLAVAFLFSGCTMFGPKIKKVNNVNCDPASFSEIQSKIEGSHRGIIKCLTENKRLQDAQNYKNLLAARDVNVRCEPQKAPREHEIAFVRESVGWLGYQKSSDIDVAAITEMCCLHQVKKACTMFRFTKKDFTSPVYLKELSENLEGIGHEKAALQTALASAKTASRNRQKTDQVRKILFAPLENLNSKALKKKMSRQQIRSYASVGEVTQGIVLASIVGRASDTHLKKRSDGYLGSLVSRFYSNPIDREKVQFFTNVGDSIEAVIFKNPEHLTKSWQAMKSRAEYVCRDLKKNEINSINELLGGVSYYVFEMKNEIPAGTMFDIATNWSKPCGM